MSDETEPDLATAIATELVKKVEERLEKMESRLNDVESSVRALHADITLILNQYKDHSKRITQIEGRGAGSLTVTPIPVRNGGDDGQV